MQGAQTMSAIIKTATFKACYKPNPTIIRKVVMSKVKGLKQWLLSDENISRIP